jgi:hypothetical protein
VKRRQAARRDVIGGAFVAKRPYHLHCGLQILGCDEKVYVARETAPCITVDGIAEQWTLERGRANARISE